jgi:lipoprotein-anchoring transpeptidase ErfK/SrfK
MRAIVLLISVMLGGCMQETLAPVTQAGWSARDRQLMSNLPYAQATIPVEYRRHIVQYSRRESPGTIVVDSDNKFLYYVLPKGQAIRYGVTVGEDAQAWSGMGTIGRKEEWPSWTPTAGEHARLGPIPAFVSGGPQKSDGCARAVSVLRWQGHAVPHPRHQPAGVYRPSYIVRVHSDDQ